MNSPDRFKSHLVSLGLLAMAALVLSACGGGSPSQESAESSAVTFRVVWDRPGDFQSSSLTDCADVNTVYAAIHTTAGALLGSGGPWDCATGSGVIDGLPANYYATIGVEGLSPDGTLLYYGQNQAPIYLDPGSVDAGVITAGPFVPELVSPIDSTDVAMDGLELRWRQLVGAAGYRVTLATDNTFATGAVVQVMVIDDGGTTSVRPDTTFLQIDTYYYWRVEAVSALDHYSAPSSTWRFNLRTTIAGLTAPVLVSPTDDAIVSIEDLELRWEAVRNAAGYRVTLALDDSFAGESVVQQTVIEGGSTTSTRPDVIALKLQENTTYYWQVEAVSAAGNISDPSPAWRLRLGRVVVTGITFWENASVSTGPTPTPTPVPINTQVAFNYSSIELSHIRYETTIDQWSAQMASSDYFALQENILEYKLIAQGDIYLDESMVPCADSGGMWISMTIAGDGEAYNQFYIDGRVCPNDWPQGVRNLVDLGNRLVIKYQPTPLP